MSATGPLGAIGALALALLTIALLQQRFGRRRLASVDCVNRLFGASPIV